MKPGSVMRVVRPTDNVFYLPDEKEWAESCQQMVSAGFRVVPSANPYWDRSGRTFEDVDGYRVVLQKGAWSG